MNRLSLITAAMVLSLPLTALAAQPQAGTDDYLRQNGWTETQLTEEIQTEERADFETTPGENTIEEPLGDVLTRVGTSSSLKVPWGDIASVDVKKSADNNTWNVAVKLGGEVPELPTLLGQLFFYVDRDGDESNNEKAGVRGLMDAEYTVTYNPNTATWDNDYRWYNPEEDFWAYPGTKATNTIVGNTITLHIPANEIPMDAFPRWRVVMAVATSDMTQVDVAPGIGFPPARGLAPEEQVAKPSVLGYTLLALAALIVIGTFVWTANQKKRFGKKTGGVKLSKLDEMPAPSEHRSEPY